MTEWRDRAGHHLCDGCSLGTRELCRVRLDFLESVVGSSMPYSFGDKKTYTFEIVTEELVFTFFQNRYFLSKKKKSVGYENKHVESVNRVVSLLSYQFSQRVGRFLFQEISYHITLLFYVVVLFLQVGSMNGIQIMQGEKIVTYLQTYCQVVKLFLWLWLEGLIISFSQICSFVDFSVQARLGKFV